MPLLARIGNLCRKQKKPRRVIIAKIAMDWFSSTVPYLALPLPELLDSPGSEDEPYHVSVSNDSGLLRD